MKRKPSVASSYAACAAARGGALPVGQTDSFDGVVAVVHLVASFKHDPEPPAAEALHRLEVGQVPGERRHSGWHHGEGEPRCAHRWRPACVCVCVCDMCYYLRP